MQTAKIILLGLIPILACMCFYLSAVSTGKFKKVIVITSCLLLSLAIYRFVNQIIFSIHTPQVWDFTAFYLWGKTAVNGYNFYKPENLDLVLGSINLHFDNWYGFKEEIVDVGFLYPPPTMLYFAPLGYFSYKTALIIWTLINAMFATGCVYLIYKMFFYQHKAKGLILVATLLFSFTPVLMTIAYAQTNFIALMLLLLLKKYEHQKIAALFLVMAIFVKPYMIVFVFYFIIRKKWATIFYFLITALAISGVTILLFGNECFKSYVYDNAVNRLPPSVYYESINQSLHSVLLRYHLISLDKPIVYKIIFVAIGALTGVYVLNLLKRKLYDFILPVLLLVILMIYPGTLTYYGVLLLFIIFQFFNNKNQVSFHPYINIILFAAVYYLIQFSLFGGICFLITIIILKSETNVFSNNYLLKNFNHYWLTSHTQKTNY